MVQKCVLSGLFMLLLMASCGHSAWAQTEDQKPIKKRLLVAVMQMPPYSMQDEDGNWSGITVDLWKEIARILDISYDLKKYDLKGIVHAQSTAEIDVAATGLSVTAAREKLYDFSTPYLSAVEAVAINADQQPSLFQVLRSTFLNWTMLLFVLLLFAVAVIGASILWLLEGKGESEHYKGKTSQAFARSLFWSTMVMSGREFPKAVGWNTVSPATFAGRLFAMFWMMFGIALVSVMTASTASVLVSRDLQGSIRNADDLRHVRVGTIASSVGEEYLKHRHIKYDHAYSAPPEMLQALADHKIDAAVYNRQIMVYYSQKMFAHKITVLSFPLRQDFLAIPMRTGFPLREKIDQTLLEVIESRKWQEIVGSYLGNDWSNSTGSE